MRSVISSTTMERRAHCPGSVEEQKLPKEDPGPYAAEGIALHDLMYRTLDGEPEPPRSARFTWPGKDGVAYTLSGEQLQDKFWPVYEAVQAWLDKHKVSEFDLEVKHTHSLGEDVYGYVDLIGRSDDGYGVIMDYKFGAQPEEVRENMQLGFLINGALDADDILTDVPHVIMAIAQPKFNDGSIVEEWTATGKWINAIASLKERIYERIKKGDRTRKAGKWCKYCGLAPMCDTANASLYKLASPAMAQPEQMSVVQISEALAVGALAVTQYEAIREFALKKAKEGVDFPGNKLIRSIGNRTWSDPEQVAHLAERALDDDAYEPAKLRSVAQMEKQYKKRKQDFSELEALIERPDRGLRLVPDTHKAPAVEPRAAEAVPDDVAKMIGLDT